MASKAKKEVENTNFKKFIKEHYKSVHKSKFTNPKTLTLVA